MGNIFKCCGKTGKPAVRIIGHIDIFLAIGVIMSWVVVSALFPGYLISPSTTGNKKHESTPNVVAIILLIVIFFLECCLFNIILSAIKNKNAGLCDNWIKIRLILLCIFVFVLIYWMTIEKEHIVVYISGGVGLLYILYRIYSLIVVKHFQNELYPKDSDTDIKKLPLDISLQILKA